MIWRKLRCSSSKGWSFTNSVSGRSVASTRILARPVVPEWASTTATDDTAVSRTSLSQAGVISSTVEGIDGTGAPVTETDADVEIGTYPVPAADAIAVSR